MAPSFDRRRFMYGLGATLGTMAFNSMLADAANAQTPAGPLDPKPQQLDGKATACIFVYLEGGPSHIDTFDPKPKLESLHDQRFIRKDKFASAMASGKRYYVKSPFRFLRVLAGQRKRIGPFGIIVERRIQIDHDPDLVLLSRCGDLVADAFEPGCPQIPNGPLRPDGDRPEPQLG